VTAAAASVSSESLLSTAQGVTRGARQRVTAVIATRDRSAELGRTLSHLAVLPERPPVIVVDNASGDATARLVRERHPRVRLVTAPRNLGVAARTLGARIAATPYVAFSDDDSWWAAGALARAADLLDAYPRLGLIAARTLVGPTGEPDPVNWSMARSPLTSTGSSPGQPVLGFLACASVVRREALLEVGGFAPFFVVGAEERLLAYDLREHGWDLAYVDDVVAHHYPSRVRDQTGRRTAVLRNDLLIDILRRPWPVVLRSALRLGAQARRDPAAGAALLAAARTIPQVLPQRRRLGAHVEAEARMLDTNGGRGVVHDV
jgi:GT2 family glycosyltransferase